MVLLRLLNLLFFGPKVTEARLTFADAKLVKMQASAQRSLRIFTVNAGSSGAEELELQALQNAYYDLERFGISFATAPGHANVLCVTGPVTRNMLEPLRLTYDAMPKPTLVVAVGDGACTGGVWLGAYGVVGPVSAVIPVDVCIPGDPPSPRELLAAFIELKLAS